MGRRSLAPLLVTAAVCGSFAAPAQASTAVTGDPWIDQYIEQVPNAGGQVRTGAERTASGLSRTQIAALAAAGGDRFAYVTAATVPASAKASGRTGKTGRAAISAVNVPSFASAFAATVGGGNGGLGPILPAALLGGLIGGIAFAGIRRRDEKPSS